MIPKLTQRLYLALLLAGLATQRQTRAENGVDFFAGKQLTIVVSSDTGGGYDANARLISRHLGHFLPGNPTILVRNMPGAGGIIATNYLYNVAPRDGTTLGIVQRGVLMARLSGLDVQYEPTKFNWLANMSVETGTIVAWGAAPQRTADDLLRHEFVVGGSGPSGETETIPRLLNAMIGAKFRVVPSYPSNASILVAMERGEVQGIADWEWPNIKTRRPDYLRDGKIRILLQSGLTRDRDLPDVPLAIEYARSEIDHQAMELFFTQKTISRPVLAPPGVPPTRLKALQGALAAMGRDPDYLVDAKQSGLEVSPQPGETVAQVVDKLDKAPKAVADRLREVLGVAK